MRSIPSSSSSDEEDDRAPSIAGALGEDDAEANLAAAVASTLSISGSARPDPDLQEVAATSSSAEAAPSSALEVVTMDPVEDDLSLKAA